MYTDRHKKCHNRKHNFSSLLIVILLIVFCISGYKLITWFISYSKGIDTYEEVVNVSDADTRNEIIKSISKGNGTDIRSEYDAAIPIMDFTALLEMNKECVAWISLPDTSLDYPVVYGRDNSFYLNHLITGEKNSMGTLFVDSRNSADFSDYITYIYGHHIRDGSSMFALLENYKEQDFYDEHRELYLYLPDNSYMLLPYAGIVISADTGALTVDFTSESEYMDYIQRAVKQSTFISEVNVAEDDRTIALCTCTYDFNNARFLLLCKLESYPFGTDK